MPNRIQILQWREFGDDEDCLTVAPFGADDDRELADIEAENHDLIRTDEDEEVPDGQGKFMVTNDLTIEDGEILENDDRRFRVLIEEIDEAGETIAGMCVKHTDIRCSDEGTCPVCSVLEVVKDESNLATILAALRLFQTQFEDCDNPDIVERFPDHFTRDDGSPIPALGSEDIDTLCEQLNCL